ncbi:MAG: translational GTPase TypA, partial [Fimbriimonadaceae bacterium]|nr:translational GTPase TypA [Fimbriimonadaceae bacterium]
PAYAYDKTLDLFIDLGADEDDLFFPVLYGSGQAGYARSTPEGTETDMRLLFEAIVEHVPLPRVEHEGPFRLQVNNLDYSEYLGRMFGGKVLRGSVKVGDRVEMLREEQTKKAAFNVTKLWTYEGIQLKEVDSVAAGEIAMLAGLDNVLISDTIAHVDTSEALPPIKVEPSTLSMNFYANNSPLSGKDGGKFLTIHKIRERVEKEEAVSVSVKIDKTAASDTVKTQARGELQLAILIETMRREGFEMQISRPQVIYKRDEQGKIEEPYEVATLEVPEDAVGGVMEEMSRRKGDLVDMRTNDNGTQSLEYSIPTRGLIGFRSTFLTLTRGLGLISS